MSPNHPHDLGRESIPIVEETLTIGKREVETGRVSVRTSVEEREQIVLEELIHTAVEIDRIDINRVIETAPEIREDGDLLIVPIVEERLVVSKELVLVQELHVRRRRVSQEFEEPVTLRKTTVEVERREPKEDAGS